MVSLERTTPARPVRASQESRLPRPTLRAVPGVPGTRAERPPGVPRKLRTIVAGVRGGSRRTAVAVGVCASVSPCGPGPSRLRVRGPVPALTSKHC
jgi:hypothetical protein